MRAPDQPGEPLSPLKTVWYSARMSWLIHDLRHALRSLARSPGFAIPALITLALGIGANTAMFSAIYGLLSKPLPFEDPGRLVALFETREDQAGAVSLADLLDWRSQSRDFAGMAAYRLRSFGLSTRGEEVAVIQAGMVTADFFPVLGVRPTLGRSFSAEEEVSAAPVVVLGHKLWRERLGGAADAVGRRILLNDVPLTVVGVLPAGVELPMSGKVPDLYVPLNRKDYGTSRSTRSLGAVGRLKPGITLAAAGAELGGISARLARAYPGTNDKIGAGVETLDEALRGKNRRPLLLLTAAGFLLLAIACINVANLLLARFFARVHRVAIRAALGAGLGGLARQFLAEGLALSLLGALLGLLTASVWLRLLPLALPVTGGSGLPAGLENDPLRLQGPAFLFALAVAAATALLFALIPTLLARRSDLQKILRQGGAAITPHHRLSSSLVIGQMALSVMLLLASGLLLRSFAGLLATDPGFRSEGVLRFGIGLPEKRYGTDLQQLAFHRELLDRLARLPGVEAAGLAARLPVSGEGFSTAFLFDGAAKETAREVALNVASPGYFDALRIPRLAGRGLSRQDGPSSPRVVLVSQAFARAYSPDRSAVGRRIRLGWTSDINPRGTVWEIAGVVGDVRQRALEEEGKPEIYLPAGQYPLDGGAYVLRTARRDPALAAAVRAEVKALDPQLERIEVRPFADAVRDSLTDRRLALLLTGIFAGVALLLTAVGLYGVVAYSVAQRQREMALRLTLGAQMGQVARLVLGQGLRLAAAGLVLGLAGFYALRRLIESHLYGVTATDPLTAAGVVAMLVLITLAACAIPSARASRIEPMSAIRS
jgi:putative ABC transport system permease protein